MNFVLTSLLASCVASALTDCLFDAVTN